jgi:ATP-binding cassette subfamily C protein
MGALPPLEKPMALPAPASSLSVESASVIVPGGQRLVVQDVTFALKAGNGLGVIGASASGKSSLARMIVGVWTPARGKVRVDGAALEQWDPEALGRHIGYLPQDVELFAGTVAQNIARFDPQPNPGP